MDKSKDILKETGCLTGQQLQDYVQGKMNREELHNAEMHLASCTFCAEALDGLSAMKKPQELPAIVQQIRQRFKKQLRSHHSGNKRMKNYIWLIVVVFVIIAILLLAYFAIDFTMKGEHEPRQQPLREQNEINRP